MISTMMAMQMPDMIKGNSTLSKLANFFSRLEALVRGPTCFHWMMARMISAKPSVAMAR